jgi:hypothetical protein
MDKTRFLYVDRADIRAWQLKTLEIQQEIQALFEKYDISGWCGGGTLIGAVRDQGFLYWDNDLDMFFCHKDYKKILYTFWQSGFLRGYDLYYNVDGYWERHERLMSILTANELDEYSLDFELRILSKTMFKIFSRNGVPVRYFENDNGNPEQYVRIKHFVNNHVTRYRSAHRDDSVNFTNTYHALPDVCMLPMVKVRYGQYLISNMLYLLYRSAILLSEILEAEIDRKVSSGSYQYQIDGKNHSQVKGGFDPAPFEPMPVKLRIVVKNFFHLIMNPFQGAKRRFSEGLSGDFMAYRQAFFRFLVLPYHYEDIFPLKRFSFEDKEILVPQNHLKILATQFGDYVSVPPLEKRIAYPFFLAGRMDSWQAKEFE